MTTYKISFSNGSTDTAETYEGAEIGHDGDLEGFGDRTLCWESEEDSIDDDGARAVASITRA